MFVDLKVPDTALTLFIRKSAILSLESLEDKRILVSLELF